MKTWNNQEPIEYLSFKIDGVNLTVIDGVGWTKNKLSSIPAPYPDGEYELFAGSWEASISVLRGTKEVEEHYFYALSPHLDARLIAPNTCTLSDALQLGYEGLIVNGKYKWKPTATYDVRVTGVLAGKGRNTGRMGSLQTEMGKVGIGFSDAERSLDWIGTVIEVECMHLTKNGKFRLPRFIRRREDKE